MHVIVPQMVQFPWQREKALLRQSRSIFIFGTVRILTSVLGTTPHRSKSNCICLCLQAFAFASLLGSHCCEEQSPQTLMRRGLLSFLLILSKIFFSTSMCKRTTLYLFKFQLKLFRKCFLFSCLLRNYR